MQQNGLMWHFPHKSRISPVLSLKEKILSRNWLCDFFDCSEAFPAIPVTPNPFDFSDFFPDLWNHKKISSSLSGVNVKYLYKHQCSGYPGVHQPKMWTENYFHGTFSFPCPWKQSSECNWSHFVRLQAGENFSDCAEEIISFLSSFHRDLCRSPEILEIFLEIL